MVAKKKVLMLCTGGTIGMVHPDNDVTKPLKPATWEEMTALLTTLQTLPFDVDSEAMELIDSSDMHPGYWTKLAKRIGGSYADYDGFVVLHGTDTMAYTATALSFMLENLDKPVIVTGSQIPLVKARNDAAQNLVTALMIAASDGIPLIPEVCILFDKVLLRGNRSSKVSSNGFAGFDSPNCEPLAKIGEYIEVNTKLVRKPAKQGFYVSEFLEDNVLPFDIFPGIKAEILEKIFDIDGLRGVVIKTYGVGNAPGNLELLEEISNAVEKKNIAVVNVTQCKQGMVEMGLYEASMGLIQNGVISGVDMTPEAALVKMMFLLGQGYDSTTAKDQMQKNLCGEQSVNVFNFIYKRSSTKDNVCPLQSQQIPAGFSVEHISKANIRFDKIKVKGGKAEKVHLRIFMNYPRADAETDINVPQCLGVIERDVSETGFVLECTNEVKRVIAPGRPVQITIVSLGAEVSWEGVILSIYTDVVE